MPREEVTAMRRSVDDILERFALSRPIIFPLILVNCELVGRNYCAVFDKT